MITSAKGDVKFDVSDFKTKGDAVMHVGKYAAKDAKQLQNGDQVCLSIDSEFRAAHARIHSAGHLLVVAIARAGRQDLKPRKGYHFQEGPYVEYAG